jgi:RNA polymerase sigma-70 factor (ECF subfamily)
MASVHLELVADLGHPVEADVRMERLRARDRATLTEVILELSPRVRAWLCRLLGPRGELDDAVQDALIEIATALPRYEGHASLRTFAHRITVRVAYRHFGRHRREPALSLVPPIDPSPDASVEACVDPESRAISRQALDRLYRCLERLPKKRRVAFVLCAIEGLTPTEAAEITGTSAVAMRSRLMHARADVTRRLSSDPYIATLIGGFDAR